MLAMRIRVPRARVESAAKRTDSGGASEVVEWRRTVPLYATRGEGEQAFGSLVRRHIS
jgi:hypothetical protein